MKNYAALKKLSIFLTSVFIIGYEGLRHKFLADLLNPDLDVIISSIIFMIGAIIFSHYVFNLIEKIERNRQQKEREAKILFDNSIDGIFIFDSNLKLIDMNNGAKVLSEWALEDAVGVQTIYSLFEMENKVDFYNENLFNNRIEEILLRKKDGATLPASITFSKIPNENIKNEKIAAIVRDLTERKQMENVIRDLYQEATQKQREAETQYKIAKKIASLRDLTTLNNQPILESVAMEINKLVSGSYTALFLFDVLENCFKLAAITNKEQSETAIELFQKMNHNDPKEHDRQISFDLTNEQKVTFIPMIPEEAVTGYLVIVEANNKKWSLHQQELIKSIMNILSISFENVLMYKKMKDIAMLEERERLAREMHDGLAQVISSIHIKIKVLELLVRDKDKTCCSPLAEIVNELNHIANEAYHEVRQNLFSLRTSMNFTDSFIDTLIEFVEQFANQNNFALNFEVCEDNCEFDISEETKLHVLRILQEALSNVRKHSEATQVNVKYTCENPEFYLFTIEDNGVGFTPGKDERKIGHYGLTTMEERAKLIQGKLTIHSKKNEGTKVILQIPKRGNENG